MHPEHCAPVIRQIHCAMEKRINHELRTADMTYAQICLIFVLMEREDGRCSLKDLERHLRLAQSTTLGIVKRAEEKGLVACTPSPEDRRSKSVRITRKGIEQYHKTQNDIAHTEAWLLGALSPEEQDTFHALLLKIRDDLCTE